MANLLASKKRETHLDVYKGLCILFIILTHYDLAESERLHLLFPFWVGMAVPIFMVISGYVYSLSYDSSVFAIGKMYSIKELSCKILRFIIPYSLVWLVEITLKILYLKEPISVGLVAKSFLGGGFGPGTYYTPVMIQIVI